MNEKWKQRLCGNNWFGDLFAWIWVDLDCTCCAFWRGVVAGGFIAGMTVWIL